MNTLMIKICGICDPAIAKQSVKIGANWIGIVFHPPSPRFVNLDQAAEIAMSTLTAGGTPVAVFVDQTAEEMHRICKAANINAVQLHGTQSRAQHHLLSDHYQRIYVQSVTQSGEIILDDDGLRYLDPDRDFILIDHVESGKGKTFNWSQFKYNLPFPWFLAGGLSPSNVALALKVLTPSGVDVASAVENGLGKKDLLLIESFIKTARGQIYAP